MINATDKVSVRVVPLECLQVKECQPRYPGKLAHYIDLYRDHPGAFAGVLVVVPSDTHSGMYALLDGHHRYCAAIMTGRTEALCVVVEGSKL